MLPTAPCYSYELTFSVRELKNELVLNIYTTSSVLGYGGIIHLIIEHLRKSF